MNKSIWMLSEQKHQVYTQTLWDLENCKVGISQYTRYSKNFRQEMK